MKIEFSIRAVPAFSRSVRRFMWFENHPEENLDCTGPACSSRCNEFNCWACFGEAYSKQNLIGWSGGEV